MTSPSPSPAPGARKFQFLRELASGGFGSVYLAKVIHADGFSRLVALKLLHKRWSENDEIASRMRDEARLLGWLRHRNIVEVLDLTTIEGRSAVVMEYLEAIDAKGLIERCVAKRMQVPVPVVLEIGASAASALDAAYNRAPYAGEKPLRVIHRDIKPSNLMLDSHGVVKVLDFGVARAEFDTREAKTAELSFGSLEYMPPERLFFEPESPASDVYSLGTTLFELLALEKLGKAKLRQMEQDRFVSERIGELLKRRKLEPAVGEELEAVLRKMLSFDESDRPTAADLVSRLRGIARRSLEPTIEEWASQHVLALIDAGRAEVRAGEASLLGQTVLEDAPPASDGGTRGSGEPESGAVKTEQFQVDLDGPESAEYTTSTGHDEARWSALKEATLASLNETGELKKASLAGLPAAFAAARSAASADTTLPGRAPTPAPAAGRAGRSTAVPASEEATRAPVASPPSKAPASLRPVPRSDARTQSSAPPPKGGSKPPASKPSEEETVSVAALPPVTANADPKPKRSRKDTRPPPPPAPVDEGGLFSLELLVAGGVVGVTGLATFAVVLVIGIPIVGWALGVWPFGTRTPAPPPPRPAVRAPIPPPPPAPEPPAPAPLEPAPAGPAPEVPAPEIPAPEVPAPEASAGVSSPTFASAMPDTRRIVARCTTGGGQADGDSVALELAAGESAGECTITAIDAARKRRTAVVKGVEARRYTCFAGAADACE